LIGKVFLSEGFRCDSIKLCEAPKLLSASTNRREFASELCIQTSRSFVWRGSPYFMTAKRLLMSSNSTEVISGQDQGRGVRDALLSLCRSSKYKETHQSSVNASAGRARSTRCPAYRMRRKRHRSLLTKRAGVGAMINFRSVCDSSMAVDRVVGRERDCSHERLS